jgi:hypothetical protein
MILTEQEYKRYLNVHLRLLYFCFCKKHKFGSEFPFEQFIKKPMDAKFEARNFFNINSSLLLEYLQENEQISGIDKEILMGFNKKISGKFVILKQLKTYAIFMDIESENFYTVYALSDPFQMIIDSLPVLVEATILPFEGKIIYDGFLIRSTYIGKNMEHNMLNQYKNAKANKLIIKTIN